jgi:hypothetical protein
MGRADARVEPHRLRHVPDVDTAGGTDVGDLVGEAHLESQERIGGVLDHLRNFDRRADDDRAGSGRTTGNGLFQHRPVQVGHGVDRRRVVAAEHDPVRVQEVVDGPALAEELRIADDAGRCQPAGRTDRQRALHDDDVVTAAREHAAGDVDGLRAGADAHEDHRRLCERLVEVAGEPQSSGGDSAGQQLTEAVLVGGRRSRPQPVELRPVGFHSYDRPPEQGKAAGHDRPHNPVAHHGHATHEGVRVT